MRHIMHPEDRPASWWSLVFWLAVALVILAITIGARCVLDSGWNLGVG